MLANTSKACKFDISKQIIHFTVVSSNSISIQIVSLFVSVLILIFSMNFKRFIIVSNTHAIFVLFNVFSYYLNGIFSILCDISFALFGCK